MSPQKTQSAVAVPIEASIPEPFLITVAEAARRLSVSTWEIRHLVRKGSLGVKKLGKTHWLISMKSVRAFAEVRS